MFGKKKKPKKGASQSIKVEIEQLSPSTVIDEERLVEIRDEMILARLNQAVPEISRAMIAGAKAATSSKVPVYKCLLSSDAQVLSTREVKIAAKNAFRGSRGGVSAMVGMAPAVSLTFSIIAFAVGQKYLSDISGRLEKINENLNRIYAFQNNEYKSRVEALIVRITSIISFWNEVLRNERVRERTLVNLDSAEAECIALLGQANETIEGLVQKKTADFDKYCALTGEIGVWLDYQSKLLAVSYHIAELKYALNLGALSKEYCTSAFNACLANATRARGTLKNWHNDEIKKLGIDLASSKRKRKGVSAAIHFFPSLIKKEQNYCPLPEELSEAIVSQRENGIVEHAPVIGGAFESDVEIVVRGGKVFYFDRTKEQ